MRAAMACLVLLTACCGGAASAPTLDPPRRFAAPVESPSFRDPARRTKLATAYDKLDGYFAAFQAKTQAPGVAVGLIVDGDLAWSKGYGVEDLGSKIPVTIDSVYRIGSITKMFTAITAVKLRDEGKLAFDLPMATVMPELAEVLYPTTDSPPVTLRRVLMHTAGIPDVGDPGTESIGDDKHPPTEASVLGVLHGMRLLSAPGSSWSYSGVGYGLAGIAIGRATGKPYREAASELLIAPLAMTSTVWDPGQVAAERLTTGYEPKDSGAIGPVVAWKFGALESAGGLYSTVRDMARFLAFNLAAWPPRSASDAGPVVRGSLREMQSPQAIERIVTSEGAGVRAHADGYGIGWQSFYACGVGLVIACTGGTEGHNAFIFAFPDRGVAMVILTNIRDVGWGGVWSDVWLMLDATGGVEARALEGDSGVGTRADPRCPG